MRGCVRTVHTRKWGWGSGGWGDHSQRHSWAQNQGQQSQPTPLRRLPLQGLAGLLKADSLSQRTRISIVIRPTVSSLMCPELLLCTVPQKRVVERAAP